MINAVTSSPLQSEQSDTAKNQATGSTPPDTSSNPSMGNTPPRPDTSNNTATTMGSMNSMNRTMKSAFNPTTSQNVASTSANATGSMTTNNTVIPNSTTSNSNQNSDNDIPRFGTMNSKSNTDTVPSTPSMPGPTTPSTPSNMDSVPPQPPSGSNDGTSSAKFGGGLSKKVSTKMMLAATLLLVVVIGGAVTLWGTLFTTQDTRQQAAGPGDTNSCLISPKGIQVITNNPQTVGSTPGSYGFKLVIADPTNANNYYDVKLGEKVNLKVDIRNVESTTINDGYHFTVQKVQESPTGTVVDENTPYNEPTLVQNNISGNDVQQNVHADWGLPLENLQPGETRTLTGTWTPTECGLFQIDMGVEDFANRPANCDGSSDPVHSLVGAGFVRVKGCQTICNAECTTDAQCNPYGGERYACVNDGWSEWADVTGWMAAVGNGTIQSFSAREQDGLITQHAVIGGRIWSRDNDDQANGGGWEQFKDVTNLVDDIGGDGPITAFTTHVRPSGSIGRFLVRNGQIWFDDTGDNEGWADATNNINVGNGTITSFSTFFNGDVPTQHLVRGGVIWSRVGLTSEFTTDNNGAGQLPGVGDNPNTTTSFYAHNRGPNDSRFQFLVRNGKIWNRALVNSSTGKICRLAADPQSPICIAPPPPPSPIPSPSPSPSPTPIGPMCLNITMNTTNPQIGDSVTFTCAQVTASGIAGTNMSYEFRVVRPNGEISPVAATGNISVPFLISGAGKHIAQCRICPNGQCQDWEPIPGGTPTPTTEPGGTCDLKCDDVDCFAGGPPFCQIVNGTPQCVCPDLSQDPGAEVNPDTSTDDENTQDTRSETEQSTISETSETTVETSLTEQETVEDQTSETR